MISVRGIVDYTLRRWQTRKEDTSVDLNMRNCYWPCKHCPFIFTPPYSEARMLCWHQWTPVTTKRILSRTKRFGGTILCRWWMEFPSSTLISTYFFWYGTWRSTQKYPVLVVIVLAQVKLNHLPIKSLALFVPIITILHRMGCHGQSASWC